METTKKHKPKKWTKEKVFEESKKYTSRGEFATNSPSAYKTALRHNWLDDMIWLVSKTKDISNIDNVYAYEFVDFNTVYIGRTINPKRRHITHKSGSFETNDNKKHNNISSVLIFALKNNIDVPNMKILQSNISLIEGQKLEKEYIEKYKLEGWNILNKAKCGESSSSLGRIHIRWTKEKVFEISKQYEFLSDFRKDYDGAFDAAYNNGWLDEMTWLKKKCIHNYWTKERVFEEAKKHNRRVDFKKKACRAYQVARKNKWLDELFPKKKN